jgi:hypothetical protein
MLVLGIDIVNCYYIFYVGVGSAMDYGWGQRVLRRAAFGCNTLLPGIRDDVLVSMIWPKIAGRLYLISSTTSEGEVYELVQCIMSLRVQSQRWKSTIDSSIEGLAVRATCNFAKYFNGPTETRVHYFRRQFKPIAALLSGTWILHEPHDLELLGNVEDLTNDQLQPLVMYLRKGKRVAKGNLCELLWYYVYNPPLPACSMDFLTPLFGTKQAFYGFKDPL